MPRAVTATLTRVAQLFYLEALVGGPAVFDPFFRAYIEHFKYKCIETEDFKAFFLAHFAGNEALAAVDWDVRACGPARARRA